MSALLRSRGAQSLRLGASAAAFLALAGLSAPLAEEGGRPLSATLTGSAEVPGPGDLDGAGTFTARVNPGQEQVCYELSASNIAAPTAAHIHRGGPEAAGPPVLTLETPAGGSSSGCVAAERRLAQELIQNPQDFYVNVHNAEFPPGAVRGQLSK